MPDPVRVDHAEDPWIKATILVPDAYLAPLLALCEERRGEQVDLTYADNRAMLTYRLLLNEVVFDFYDRLKPVCAASPPRLSGRYGFEILTSQRSPRSPNR
jgi:GTP-binding protein LepA